MKRFATVLLFSAGFCTWLCTNALCSLGALDCSTGSFANGMKCISAHAQNNYPASNCKPNSAKTDCIGYDCGIDNRQTAVAGSCSADATKKCKSPASTVYVLVRVMTTTCTGRFVLGLPVTCTCTSEPASPEVNDQVEKCDCADAPIDG